MRRTILPSCSPLSRRSWAAAASASGKTVSIDRPCPAGRDQVVGALEVLGRAHRRAHDRQLAPPDPVQRRGRVRARGRSADDDPRRRARPRRASASRSPRRRARPRRRRRRRSARERGPGRPRSRGSRSRRRRARGPRSSFASLDDVTIVRPPSAFAIASAAVETPLPIPQISTHSPGWRRAFVTSMRYAVRKTSGNAAASSNERSPGIGWTALRGTATSSAYVPSRCSPSTSNPALVGEAGVDHDALVRCPRARPRRRRRGCAAVRRRRAAPSGARRRGG